MLTQPIGERFVPPIDRTAVGAADFAERTVIIAVKRRRESEQLASMYRRLGWNVLTADRPKRFVELLNTEFADLVVTDRFRCVVALRSLRRDGRTPPTHFIANDATHAKAVFEAGVDAIMVRTMNHDDFFNYDFVTRPD